MNLAEFHKRVANRLWLKVREKVRVTAAVFRHGSGACAPKGTMAEQVPLPAEEEQVDFDLFGPGLSPCTAPVGPQLPQASTTVGNAQQAPVAQPVPQVNVGLDPTLQQMLLGMMQTQQNMLQLLVQKQEEDERRRRQNEAANVAVANPFDGHTGSPTSGGMGGAASSGGPGSTVGTGSNRAEKYLPNCQVSTTQLWARDV